MRHLGVVPSGPDDNDVVIYKHWPESGPVEYWFDATLFWENGVADDFRQWLLDHSVECIVTDYDLGPTIRGYLESEYVVAAMRLRWNARLIKLNYNFVQLHEDYDG